MFAGVDENALRRVQCIIMEYHPNGQIADIGERLEKLHFDVEVAPKRSVMFAWRR